MERGSCRTRKSAKCGKIVHGLDGYPWVRIEGRVVDGTRPKLVLGAAPSAPTAPHATFPDAPSKTTTGPQRFWDLRRVRIALSAGFVLSIVFHWLVGPWSFFPEGPAVEFHDLDGELTIPIDTISEAPKDEPKVAPTSTGTNGTNGNPLNPLGLLDAAADHRSPVKDGGAGDQDGGEGDANDSDSESDAEAVDEAGIALGGGDGGAGGTSGPGSPFAGVSAGPNNITLIVNMAVIRAHPEGSKLGPILAAIPQWRAFLTSSAASGTTLDPLHDLDWLLVMGPALDHTEKDAVYVHYSTEDVVVDKVIDSISKTYVHGGPVDVKVKGVKAWKAYADGAERVFLRPRPHVAVIVPATHATQFAQVVSQSPFNPHMRPGEAVSLRAIHPGGSISIIPQSISEMRLWIVPHTTDSGADVYAEGDCPDATSATDAAEKIKGEISRRNSIGVRLITSGLFNAVDVTTDGPMVKLHIPATKEQIDAILGLAAQQVGATLPGDAPAPSSPLR